jgi:hypothetical protein
VKEGRGRGVDRPSKKHEAFSEDIGCKPGDDTLNIVISVWQPNWYLKTVCPSTPVCSKLIPADPSAQTIIWSWTTKNEHMMLWIPLRRTLSYQRLVQVPTWTPLSITYVPHKNVLHMSARSMGVASSKQTMNKALSTICRHEALFLSFDRDERIDDHALRFSVERTPMAPFATYSEKIKIERCTFRQEARG